MDRTDIYQKYDVLVADEKAIGEVVVTPIDSVDPKENPPEENPPEEKPPEAKYFVLRVDRKNHWWDRVSRWALERIIRRLASETDKEMQDFGKTIEVWLRDATGEAPPDSPKIQNYWVPEAPDYPGVYAPKGYRRDLLVMTLSFPEAMRFTTKEKCQAWCDENPSPKYTPREHAEL